MQHAIATTLSFATTCTVNIKNCAPPLGNRATVNARDLVLRTTWNGAKVVQSIMSCAQSMFQDSRIVSK